MSKLQEKLAGQIPSFRNTVKTLQKEHGSKVISSVTVEQAYGGMRGVKSLVCDTSEVPPDKGLIVRGIPIAQLTDRLPEEVLWLLLTGELPNAAELADLQADLRARAAVPAYVWAVLAAMPADSHPMVMLSTAILVLQRESVFRARYDAGLKKDEYWIPSLEDTLNIVAQVPAIAAGIYRQRFGKGPRIASNPSLDWAADYAHMLGIPDPTGEFVPVWCGGMLESGIGRAHNIALSTLPNFVLPGDVSASKRYWSRDVIAPPVEVTPRGTIVVRDDPGFEFLF
jgi:citrate synthase